jgi:hypothetical protein
MKPWMRLGGIFIFCSVGYAQTNEIIQDRGERYYVDAFGGVYASDGLTINQQGSIPYAGYNVAVSAVGRANFQENGLVGGSIGYQVQNLVIGQKKHWHFIPSFELEGFYLTSKLKANLVNPENDIAFDLDGEPLADFSVPAGQQILNNTFQYHAGFIFPNVVFSFKGIILEEVEPYVGFGIGAAFDQLTASTSHASQSENYFLPQNNAFNAVLAAQIKSGFQLAINKNMNVFVEYRYIYAATSNYRMGSKLEDAQWNLDFGTMHINAGVVGVGYYFDEVLRTSNSTSQ